MFLFSLSFERMKGKKVEIEKVDKENELKENSQKEEMFTPKKEKNIYRKEKESLEKKRRVRSIKEIFENIKKKEEIKENAVQCDFIRSECSRNVAVSSVLPKSGLGNLNPLMVYDIKKENVLLNSSPGKRKFSEVEPQNKSSSKTNYNLHFTPKKRREI